MYVALIYEQHISDLNFMFMKQLLAYSCIIYTYALQKL